MFRKNISFLVCQTLKIHQQILKLISPNNIQMFWLKNNQFSQQSPSNDMELVKPLPLSKVFLEEPQYAWDLLEWEVEVETSSNIDGKDVAKLLSLYMRGVEKLNSLQDKREQFFQMRMTNMMMKPNVVKILSSPVKNNSSRQLDDNKNQINNEPKMSMNYIHRMKQMEMQIQYNLSSSTDNLNKLLSQHNTKTQTVQNKINQVISESQNKLQQRIKKKQIKAQIARSQSQKRLENESPIKRLQFQKLNIIEEEPRSRRGSKIIKRKYSLQLSSQELLASESQLKKSKRKLTQNYDKQIQK